MKGKVYKTAMRPAVMHGLKAVMLTKSQKVELKLAGFKLLPLFMVVFKMVRIRNEYNGTLGYAHPGILPNQLTPFPDAQILHWHAPKNPTCTSAPIGTTVFPPLPSHPKPRSRI